MRNLCCDVFKANFISEIFHGTPTLFSCEAWCSLENNINLQFCQILSHFHYLYPHYYQYHPFQKIEALFFLILATS